MVISDMGTPIAVPALNLMPRKILFKTGNILGLDGILKRPGQEAMNEMFESLKATLHNSKKVKNEKENIVELISHTPVYTNDVDPKELLTTVKVFASSETDMRSLKYILNETYKYLELDKFSSVVLSYIHDEEEKGVDKLAAIKALWLNLEELVSMENLCDHIGISDLETNEFIELYNWARIKPNIVQLSLTGCCIVPPTLQEFARNHDVNLLTHSDPSGALLNFERLQYMLTESNSGSFMGLENRVEPFNGQEAIAVKFQSHFKCRGILATKGYLVAIPPP